MPAGGQVGPDGTNECSARWQQVTNVGTHQGGEQDWCMLGHSTKPPSVTTGERSTGSQPNAVNPFLPRLLYNLRYLGQANVGKVRM